MTLDMVQHDDRPVQVVRPANQRSRRGPVRPRRGQDHPSPSPPRRWVVPAAAAAGPVILAAVLVNQPHLVSGAVDAVLRARPVWLIAAVGAEIASMSAFSRLQARSLHMTGYEVRHRTALAINYASNAISATVPIVGSAAGTANTWRQYQKRGAAPAAVTWALGTAGVLSALAFSVLMALAAVASGNAALAGAGAGVTVTAVGLAVGYVAVSRAPSWSGRVGRKLESLVSRLVSMAGRPAVDLAPGGARRFVENLMSYRVTPGSLTVAVTAGFLNWAFDVACLGLSIRSVGGHIPWTVLVVVWAGAGAASSLSFTPSGLGIVEPILVASLAATGLDHTQALAATALYRLISFVLVAAAGWVIELSLTRKPAGRLAAAPVSSDHPFEVQQGEALQPLGRSAHKTVVEVYDAVAKAALVQQLELGMDAGRQSALATTNKDRPQEEMALVDQPLGYRLAG